MSEAQTQGDLSHGNDTYVDITNSENRLANSSVSPPASTKSVKPAPNSYFSQSIRAIFGFRKTSLTLFVVITYALVILLFPLQKKYNLTLPSHAPSYLDSAWSDLQIISKNPHPYISHANDDVHDYIYSRVHELASNSSIVTIDDDVETNLTVFDIIKSTWNSTSEASPLHYFESGNILVKIEGRDPTLEGVLLSAHFDSVPTAYGTTDDSTGIASLLGILEYYVSTGEQPLRTIVFNFNNNEEFGLFGAVAFFKHPWSNLVKFFINLEGTGTGERAILFRTTDYDVTKFYKNVRGPFATSIYQQGFASGLVGSETDYRIYAGHGLRGFDIAFYKPRSLYHTDEDNIRHSTKSAVWHMLSRSLDLTKSLAEAEQIGDDSETPAVFFDFLGIYFVALRLSELAIINIVLLSIIPIFLFIFAFIISKRNIWNIGYSWIRFPVSLGFSSTATHFIVQTINHVNPFIPSRDFISPLVLVSSVFLFINYAILTTWDTLWPVRDFKLLVTLEVYSTLWVWLVYRTYKERTSNIYTGEYLFTILYIIYSVSSILGLFSIAVSSPKTENIVVTRSYGTVNDAPNSAASLETDENSPLLGTSHANSSENNENVEDDEGEEETEEHDVVEELGHFIEGHKHHKSLSYDWSLQFLILVPVSFLISYISTELILEGLNQTIQESLKAQNTVYGIILVSGILLTIPVLSFAHKLNYLFAILLIITILSSGIISLFKYPFTHNSPIKFRFYQNIDLDNDGESIVNIFGREGFLTEILEDLPSVKKSGQNVTCTSQVDGNEICSYLGYRPYLLNGTKAENQFESYLNIDIQKTGAEGISTSPYSPLTAEFSINAKENRFCYLAFNTSSFETGKYGKSPIKLLTYYKDNNSNLTINSGDTVQDQSAIPIGGSQDAFGNRIFKWLQGIDEVHLHKLDWNQDSYHIGLQWVPKWLEDGEEQQPADSPGSQLGVQVSCYWGEWDDVSVVDEESLRKIPAYDEILEYTALTTSWSNRYEGLVRINKYITL
ncbi:hypothetical protein WICMUC_001003 [Wickerhamomyces mucosus]|uniref:Peptide hydrolase n=1 Tax=Wickerhamomyces mucosus TaxID=1378264 RepID=A0A9P8TH51_9ASCO|nr:hypothetical protein WICMUC_001003 [Wickerhamomyces mucosus]